MKLPSQRTIYRIFFQMFERAIQPDTVSIKDNQFKVDSSIEEMTLLVFLKPGSKPTKLFSPDGNRYSALKKGNSNWRSDEGYDLINRKPEIITSVDSFLAELIDIYKKLKPKREEFQVVEESPSLP